LSSDDGAPYDDSIPYNGLPSIFPLEGKPPSPRLLHLSKLTRNFKGSSSTPRLPPSSARCWTAEDVLSLRALVAHLNAVVRQDGVCMYINMQCAD
jgi:hypothetical protein